MNKLVCIVTGANSLTGIGRASVFAFAKKSARAIYATDIYNDNLASLAEEITSTTGVECIPKRVDASSDDDIQEVINDALAKYGRLDVFFANVGVAGSHPMATETKDAFLDIGIINRAAYIIVAGIRSGAGPVSYSASKAAPINIVQPTAWRLHGKNIRVTAICPGIIATEMTEEVLTSSEAPKHYTALERTGNPMEIAYMAAFLARHESSYITGQDIKVDGGLSAAYRYIPYFADG